MKKVYLFFIPFFLFLLTNCKKDTALTTKTSATSSSGCNGILEVGKIIHFASGTIQSTEYIGNASFGFGYGTSWAGDPSQEVSVDTVKLNGVPMLFLDGSYNDTLGMSAGTSLPIAYPYTFQVAGKNGIPSFSYTENGPFPSYTGYLNIPDTIYKNSGLTIPLSGISNADNLTIVITNGSGGPGHEISQQFLTTIPSSVTFSAGSMSQFNISNANTIQILLMKTDNKTLGGKPMCFTTALNFSKTVSVK